MLGVVNPAPWVYVGTDDPTSPAFENGWENAGRGPFQITQGNRI